MRLWQQQPERRIFISYRRSDAEGFAGRLNDTLDAYFGEGRVFRDIESIQGGSQFAEVIDSALSQADALIVLIGPGWLNATDSEGRSRLHDPDDFVALEIATALEREIPVYPVLVKGARMPTPDELPERLRRLSDFNAVSLATHNWKVDATRLAKIMALDVPGSLAERELFGVNLWICASLLGAVGFTAGTIAVRSILDQRPALLFWQSGVTFVFIMLGAYLLHSSLGLLDDSKRRFALWASRLGLFGGGISFMLISVTPEPHEAMSMFFLSTTISVAMLGLMSLSGLKPK